MAEELFDHPGVGEAEEERNVTAAIINEEVTPDRILASLEELHDALAPSGTVLYTRTPVIERQVWDAGIRPSEFTTQFLGTRSPAVLLNYPKNIWFTPHSDQIGYVPPFTNETTFDITPIAAHRPTGDGPYPEFPASVLRFTGQGYEIISQGVIGTEAKDMKPYYVASTKPKDGFLPGYDRIAYTPAFVYDKETGLIQANNDNAAGVTATIVALGALKKIADARGIKMRDMGFGVVFPDEEEGLPESSAYFSREARRIAHRMPTEDLPEYIVDVDGHDTLGDEDPGDFATYASIVSGGKGAIVPPDVYAGLDQFLQGLRQHGVDTRPVEGWGTVSRSNDVGWMEVSGQVIPVGYLGRDPHHNKGISTTNVEGLVNTAKAIAWIAAEGGSL